MAKSVYKVPASIARKWLDHEIKLHQSLKPTPLKQLLFIFGTGLFGLWTVMATFIKHAPFGLKFLYVVWGIGMIAYFGGMTKTKELRAMTLPALLAYVPTGARKVYTRRSSDPSAFGGIVGIQDVDPDGRIHYWDKSVGQVYLIVGSASYLLFDDDRTEILDRVDSFWRKVDSLAQWCFITNKEPQRVHHQIAKLEDRNEALTIRDPDLIELQNEQYDILHDHVGGKFTSIHQYVLIKGKSPDGLRRAHQVLQAEVEGSALIIKEATMLDREEALPMLRVFYTGVDDDALRLNLAA